MKKTVLGAFSIAMMLLFLSACTKQSQQVGESLSLIGEAEKDIFQKEGYPIVSEPITLKTIVLSRPINGPFEDMPTIQRWEKKAGINLDIQEIPRTNYKEKRNLLFASDDLPDIIMAEVPSNIMDYAGFSVRQLDGYIENYMPNLKGILAQRPTYRKVMQEEDGHIYSLISIEEFPERKVGRNVFINKVWLDRLGLEVPQTTEEFYQALKRFKEGDPNGNGIADEIPLTYKGGGGSWDFLNIISGSFVDVFDGGGIPPLMLQDGKVMCIPLAEPEGFKELVLYMQKLYQEGLADVESYTQDHATFASKGGQNPNILGVFSEWHDTNMLGPERIADYTPLPPLMGPSGRKQWVSNKKAYYRRGMFTLPTVNPYPASTMRFIDMAYEPEFAWQIMYGPWDILLKRSADGQIETIPPPEGLSPDEFRFQYTPATRFPYGLLEAEYENFTPSIDQQRKIARTEEYYLPYVDASKYVPDMRFTKEEKDELSVLTADIKPLYRNFVAKWITRGEDPVAEWEDFVAQMQKARIERYLEIYQAAYERYKG